MSKTNNKPNRKRLTSLKKLLDVIEQELFFEIRKSDNDQAAYYLETATTDMRHAIDAL